MGWLYDRTVTISRDASVDAPSGQTGGVLAYGGRTIDGAKDVVVASDLAATIQPRGRQRSKDAALPGEAPKAQWLVLLPPSPAAPADGQLVRGMIVKDDLGRAFSVFAAEPSPMGWRLLCDQLEV